MYAAICAELKDLRAIRELKGDSRCWNSKLEALSTRFDDVSYGTLVSIASQQYQDKMRRESHWHRQHHARHVYYNRYDAGARMLRGAAGRCRWL